MAAPKGNQYGRGNQNAGRPLKFKSVDELQKKIDAYFADCDPHITTGTLATAVMVERRGGKEKLRKPAGTEIPDEWRMLPYMYTTKQKAYTITGLATWLNTDRELLISYQKMEAFSDAIKGAKAKIHEFWECALYDGSKSAAGVIFNLKNNWGWRDRVEVTEQRMETGYEHLTDEELKAKLDEFYRKEGVVKMMDLESLGYVRKTSIT